MTKQEIEQRIKQGKKDRAVIDVKIAELESKLKEFTKPKWIAAVHRDAIHWKGDRLILNLDALSENCKHNIRHAIDRGCNWISITPEGACGNASTDSDGLKNYQEGSYTRIVFETYL